MNSYRRRLQQMKHCPVCDEDLAVAKFGICRARKDGRNLYCKVCIRRKVQAGRRALKEYNAAKKNRALPLFDSAESVVVPLSRLPEVERVKAVCSSEPQTLVQIAKDSKLHVDTVEELLARLQLAREVVRTVSGDRAFFRLAPERPAAATLPLHAAERKPMQLSQGFSRLSGLMPGRKTG